MSDTARDYRTADQANMDGLEDLLEITPTAADILTTNADILTVDTDSGEWVTAAEAAGYLKKSERTIQRYAKSGKLRSKTDNTGRLMIWMTTCADSDTTCADSDLKLPTSADSERFWNLLKEKDAKIEALVMRNGYLQAQLETSQEAIKLLTDSQHKSGWWHRAWRWFIGAK